VVVHTWVEIDAATAKARVISARKAEASERLEYEEHGVLDSLAAIADRKGIQLDARVNDLLRKELAIAETLR
jgi:hypothetical protein